MHDIEPFWRWRDDYIASEDKRSPFYGREYSEFEYDKKIYNYYIHPQWDEFGSVTLYTKLLFAEYDEGYAILEMLGEWNDCIENDIMFFKNNVVNHLTRQGISKFILLCENVLNFHGSDDSYYEEWYEDIRDERGWICCINTNPHVWEEMKSTSLHYYVNFGREFNDVNWRPRTPQMLFQAIDALVTGSVKRLRY